MKKSHSSLIKYECFKTSDINWYSNLSDWQGVHSFGLVKKNIIKKVKVKNERKNAKKKKLKKQLQQQNIDTIFLINKLI